jgi:hypothetical protein
LALAEPTGLLFLEDGLEINIGLTGCLRVCDRVSCHCQSVIIISLFSPLFVPLFSPVLVPYQPNNFSIMAFFPLHVAVVGVHNYFYTLKGGDYLENTEV